MTTAQESPADDRRTILVVDDTRENLTVIAGLLGPYYRVRAVNSGERALKAVETQPYPDLILLDVMMPEMDGYAVLRALRKNPLTIETPVIFVTAMDADEDEERGLEMGAVDYITKPIRPAILLARVKSHLELKQARDLLRHQNDHLESEVQRRTRENELIKDISLNALAGLAEKRDNETGNHLYRTQAYVEALMQHLADHPRFKDQLTPAQQTLISKAAPLHDIGKVGIPDSVLLKPGKLTAEEYKIIQTHSLIGSEAIDQALRRVQTADRSLHENVSPGLAFLVVSGQIVRSHHERWDGTGYPDQLAGESIPLAARIMALADVYDALITPRVYKAAATHAQAVEIIRAERGKHFDPVLTDLFFSMHSRFAEIAARKNSLP